jgi:hypothetical protein
VPDGLRVPRMVDPRCRLENYCPPFGRMTARDSDPKD